MLAAAVKSAWQFDGFVVSDWFLAVKDTVRAANAGLDMEMPLGTHFGTALKDNRGVLPLSGNVRSVAVIGYDAGQGKVFVLDGQGPAPRAATLDAFGGLGLDLVPGRGLLAARVPPAVGTWLLLLAGHGRAWLRAVLG